MTGFSPLNYVNVGPHGTFRPSGAVSTGPADIDAIFAHLRSAGADRICLHFHGGLVGEAKGMIIAESMYPVYTDAGAHAVSFVWETGFKETIARNLRSINETKLFQKLLRYAIRQLTKRLGVDLSGRGPGEPMTMDEIQEELDKIDRFEEFDATARGGAAALDEDELESIRLDMELELQLELEMDAEFGALADDLFAEDPHLRPEMEDALRDADGRGPTLFKIAKFLALVVYRVLKRYVQKRDHGLYPTVMEELVREFYIDDVGGWVWGKMKDVATQMFLPNLGPLTEASHPGTYFLKKLAAHQATTPGFKVDLVGHSAGSIAICQMFKAMAASGETVAVRNVVFLAPACTMQLMHDEIVAHPERYERFRMFTMTDANERADHLIKRIYTRSLLYLISGILEEEADTPIAGMARYWTGEPPYDAKPLVAVTRFLGVEGTDRVVLSDTLGNAEGMNSTALGHGDFDNDAETLASLAALVRMA